MSQRTFATLLAVLGIGFALAFAGFVMPAFLAKPDVLGAFAGGFVNPFASGYALDTIVCWLILAAWVIHERTTAGIRHGWIALLLGIVPGVATGLAVYLLMRIRQASPQR